MRIPADAIIAREKLSRYLLIPLARSDKSRYLARAGFTLANPEELERAIRILVASVEAVEDNTDEYGTDFIVTGKLPGINGVSLSVKIIWVRGIDGRFRLVTLKPFKEPK